MTKYIKTVVGAVVSFAVFAVPVTYGAQATITPLGSSGVVNVGVPQTVSWQSSNFPSGGKVDVNLMLQTSASPRNFKLVRGIAKGIANTGNMTWTPVQTDAGTNMYVQIACSSVSVFKEGCVSAEPTAQLAVLSAPATVQTASTLNTLFALRDALTTLLQLMQSR